MMMQRMFFFGLFVMRTVSNSIGSKSESLLTCSKFHFEEKVLEKLVRLEHKVEMYEETIQRWENTFVSKLEKFDEIQRQSETFFKSMQTAQAHDEMRLNNSYSEIIDTFKYQINNETQFYEEQMYNLFASGSSKIQNKFRSFEEKTKLLTNNQRELIQNLLNNIKTNITNSFQNMQSKQNVTNVEVLNALSEIRTFERKLAEDGVKFKTLERQVSDNNRKVAVTACVSVHKMFSDYVVRFSNVHFQVGIDDIDSFKSSGKFVCEIPGLYYISAHISTKTTSRGFFVQKNNLSIAYSASNPDGIASINSISAVVELQPKDTLHVGSNHFINAMFSCMSLMKVE